MSNLIQNKEDYANSTSVPTADQLSLKLVLEYYDAYVEPYIYTYTGENVENITLRFTYANAPHLIGLHYGPNAKYGRNSTTAKKFKGYTAYKSIKNGTIDKHTIKSLYQKKNQHYSDMTKKMRYFFTIHEVLENPEAVYYNKSKNKKKSKSDIDCDILLYKFLHNQYIHVGLDKVKNKYVPKTFLIESTPLFIKDQTIIEIKKSEKIRHRRDI